MTQLVERSVLPEHATAAAPVRPDSDQPLTPQGAWVRRGKTLIVASTGGHLEQLYRLQQRFRPLLDDVEWATFDTGQSRHLLAEEIVHYVPFVKPKDARGTFLDSIEAARLLGQHRFVRVIS